jgi:hypothetical protein
MQLLSLFFAATLVQLSLATQPCIRLSDSAAADVLNDPITYNSITTLEAKNQFSSMGYSGKGLMVDGQMTVELNASSPQAEPNIVFSFMRAPSSPGRGAVMFWLKKGEICDITQTDFKQIIPDMCYVTRKNR